MFAEMHPVAFRLIWFDIRWYGVFAALGFLSGMSILHWRAKKNGFPVEKVADLITGAIIGGLLGARIYFVIQYWDTGFADNPLAVFRIDQGGLVFYGGFIGATITLIIMCRWQQLKALQVSDMVALALPLSQALGRIGCFLNACCYGKITDSSIGITYPAKNFSAIRGQQLKAEKIDEFAQYCMPVLPTQLFQVFINLAIFGILLLLISKMKKSGQLFALYLIFYSCGRFINEFFRGDYSSTHYYFGMTVGQLTGLLVLPVGIGLFHFLGQRKDGPDACI